MLSHLPTNLHRLVKHAISETFARTLEGARARSRTPAFILLVCAVRVVCLYRTSSSFYPEIVKFPKLAN